MNMAVAALPEDLIIDILMRLPVKSLVRLRCVCKLWLSIIKDPYIIRKHIDRVNLGNEYEVAILCICSTPSASDIKIVKSTDIIFQGGGGVGGDNHQGGNVNNPATELLIKEINIPTELRCGYIRLKASCDGLLILCKTSLNSPLLWNPSIGKYKILPPSTLKQMCNFYSLYGVGYDPLINDYKVLRVPFICFL